MCVNPFKKPKKAKPVINQAPPPPVAPLAPPPPPPAPAPLPASEVPVLDVAKNTDKNGKRKKRKRVGRSALRIDRASAVSGSSGSGLGIPQ